MSVTTIEKFALGIAGLTAVGIGGFILVAPHAFFASYGIALGDDASLLSELRAPAAGLLAFGVLMLAGIWRTAIAQVSKAVALTVFIAFPAGRVLGLIVDGWPSTPILAALIFEVAVAALCIVTFSGRFAPARAILSGARPKH